MYADVKHSPNLNTKWNQTSSVIWWPTIHNQHWGELLISINSFDLQFLDYLNVWCKLLHMYTCPRSPLRLCRYIHITRVARFFDKIYQSGGKYTQLQQNYVPNDHKIYQMATTYSKWALNIPTISFLRPSKIYPNWDFLVWKYTIWQPCI
jgi:hypothetical protein